MKLRLIALTILCFFMAACSKMEADPYKSYRQYSSGQIYQKGLVSMGKGHYDVAAKDFEALNGIYPFGAFAEPAQLDLIYSYYMDSQKDAAIAAADRYIRLYPQNPHIDYAYYMRGTVQFTTGMTWLQRWWGSDPAARSMVDKQEAFLAFSQLVRFYPNSIYTPDAIVRMHYIRNELARQQLLIAAYYWERGAFLACANRASGIVQNYQGTPAVIPALALMVRSYRQLGLVTMANNTLRILEVSYPNAPELKRLR